MAKHLLKDLSFREFRARLAERPVILLPFGSQEEQGPFCPMGDYMLTEALADRVAESSGAIAAPTIPFGYADYFRGVPGGIQLRAATFAMLLEDICRNFIDHGVEHLLIFNGHTGNAPVIDQTVRLLKQSTGLVIPFLNIWRAMTPEVQQRIYGGRAAEHLGHGADPLTSVYLHLFPELVRIEGGAPAARHKVLGLPHSGLGAVKFQGVEVNIPLDVHELGDSGIVSGDPSLASAEIGRQIVEHVVKFTTDFITHFRAQSPRVKPGGPQ